MGNSGGDMTVDWIWRLCSMAFERSAVPEDWRSAVNIPLYKGKKERTTCRNYYRGWKNIYENISGESMQSD